MADATRDSTKFDRLEWAVWPSFAMLAGIQLDLFTYLKDGPLSAERIAEALGVGPDKLKPLLYALAATGLLTVEDNLFSNTSGASQFLVRGIPSYRGEKHKNLLTEWNAGLKTADSIRSGSPQAKLDFSSASKDRLEIFFRGNHLQALRRGRELAAMLDLSSHRKLLDVGGGSGGIAITLTETYPHIQVTVIDLPKVTPITQRIVEETGAGDRVRVMTGDVVGGSLEGSFDAVVLSSFIQVISRDKARSALKNVGKVTESGGMI